MLVPSADAAMNHGLSNNRIRAETELFPVYTVGWSFDFYDDIFQARIVARMRRAQWSKMIDALLRLKISPETE